MAQVKISELQAADPIEQTDLFEVVQAGVNKKATAAQVAQMVEGLGQYSTLVGDGSAVNINVNHNLNSRRLHVSVRRAVAPYDEVLVDNECPTVNTVTLKFGAIAPAIDAFEVTVSK